MAEELSIMAVSGVGGAGCGSACVERTRTIFVTGFNLSTYDVHEFIRREREKASNYTQHRERGPVVHKTP